LLLSQNHEYDLNAVTQAGLSILWSLSVEELFYTVWAPAVRWLSRTGFLILLAAL
jgi:peptidoglycan/LPS O-acetylase OafA/YrhL